MTKDDNDLPRQFGAYLLKQKLARGGMAELYLAEMRGPGGFVKPMVIKMIRPQFGEDERFLSMFTDEAKILSGLAHGNIVPIFDFGKVGESLYLAMEFIDGVDVATLIDTCRLNGIALPLDVVLWIGIGAASGLSHAHGAQGPTGNPLGVVHRDISPQNIMTSRSGEVKLCDFGIAVSAIMSGNTDSGVIKGKLRYFSPEQAAGNFIDARSDIFSLGIVLYELIVGHHPIPSGSDVVVLHTLANDAGYPPLSETAPWVSPAVAEVVDKATAVKREDRYKTAEDLRRELSRILHNEFPEFAPKRLADLVEAVQTAHEQGEARDIDSIIRAQLASFASASRDSTAGKTRPEKKSGAVSGRFKGMAAIGAALVVAIAVIALVAFNSSSKQAPSLGADPALRSGARPYSDDSAQNEKTPGQTSEKQPAKALSDAGELSGKDEAATEIQAKPKRKAYGIIDVNASPWAEVEIDGIARGATPIIGLRLGAGRHRAAFRNPELGAQKTESFVVKADETTKLIVEME
jgi:serine/threonine protein kinase